MDTIYRGTYCALQWLLLSRVISHAGMNAWTDMSPMGSRLRGCGRVSLGKKCIIILDIAILALHILITRVLDIVFWSSCECLSMELVIDEY